MKVVVLVVLLLGLPGCGVWTAVAGDPLEAGPQIEALEARNPVVSDLELESGERVKFTRHDGGSEGVTLASDSGRYSMTHRQSFVPADGRTTDEVEAEILAAAEAAGWEMYGTPRATRFCGQRSWGSTDQQVDHLNIFQGSIGVGEGSVDGVHVVLAGTSRCNFDSTFTEPWEG